MAAGVALASMGFGCGRKDSPKSLLDEGMAAEALGDYETAVEKYQAAADAGEFEGLRKVVEAMMRMGEDTVLAWEPKDEEWAEKAQGFFRELRARASQAETLDVPVEGVEETLAKFEEVLRRACPSPLLKEGMAAEAEGDYETAIEKYEEAANAGEIEGWRKLAEAMIRMGEERLLTVEPKDAEWVETAQEYVELLRTAGKTAEEAGVPVEGLEEALAKYEVPEKRELEEKAHALQGARARRDELKKKKAKLEEAIREKQKRYDQYDNEGAEAINKILGDITSQKEHRQNMALASALSGQGDAGYSEWSETMMNRAKAVGERYEKLMAPLKESIRELKEQLAEVEDEMEECLEEIQLLEGKKTKEETSPELQGPHKPTASERETMWDGW